MTNSNNAVDGFAIALAWPETLCKQAGAWYDGLMYMLGINRNGYYRVGHAAIVLVNAKTGKCHYYDFGRYHAPHGKGRIRSEVTDHDLKIKCIAKINRRKNVISNLPEILKELAHNGSTHGTGTIHGALFKIDFEKAQDFIGKMQTSDFLPYGPFRIKGTNCSRFVNTVLQKSGISLAQKLYLKLPWMITPTPMFNLKARAFIWISVPEIKR